MQIGQHVVLVDDQWPRSISSREIRAKCRLPLREIVNPKLRYKEHSLPAEICFRAYRFKPLAKLKIEDFIDVREPA